MASHRRPIWKSPWILPILALSGVLVFAGIIAFQAVKFFGRQMATTNALQQIMMAMNNYANANGCYPPQYLADQNGRPTHSWRVLILRFLDNELYRRYRFDEPWNGPHNRLLASETPACFRSQNADWTCKSGTTDYVGIAGKDTPWRGTVPLRAEDVIPLERRHWKEQKMKSRGLYEGTHKIWFVEVANSGINWMEPRDIPLEQALVGINVPGGIQGSYSSGLPAWMIDENCEWVPVGISPDAFRKMLTIPRGEEKNASGTKASAPKGAGGAARTDFPK